MDAPRTRLSTTVLGTPDPRGLAGFYQRLLGWSTISMDGPSGADGPDVDWVIIRPDPVVTHARPDGTEEEVVDVVPVGLAFQLEVDHVAPVWPPEPGRQQMMMHLDIGVDDLAAGVDFAVSLGAHLASVQPQDDVRVMIDPAGHPFCLFES